MGKTFWGIPTLYKHTADKADEDVAAKDDTLAATEETEQEQDERVLPEIDDPNNDR